MRTTKLRWIVLCCAGSVLGCYSSQGRGNDDVAGDAADAVVDVDPSGWLDVVGETGETGWGDSSTPWAPPAGVNSLMSCSIFGLWSEPGAVYVMLDWGRDADAAHPPALDLQQNHGDGWRIFLDTDCAALWADPFLPPSCPNRLTGGFDDALMVWPPAARIREGGFSVEGLYPGEVFIVRDDLAYALGGDAAQPVIRWDGASWGPVPAVFPDSFNPSDLWADENMVAVVGQAGTLRTLAGTEWRQWATGTLADLYQVWGFGDGELWVFSARELWRCRDETCEPMVWPDLGDDVCGGRSIQFVWGKDGVLFFATDHELVRWDGTTFDVLAYWPATYVPDPTHDDCRGGGLWIQALWGNSPDEVFLAVDGLGYHSGNCFEQHLLRWDGTDFHWF
jgi:hypothetical protein